MKWETASLFGPVRLTERAQHGRRTATLTVGGRRIMRATKGTNAREAHRLFYTSPSGAGVSEHELLFGLPAAADYDARNAAVMALELLGDDVPSYVDQAVPGLSRPQLRQAAAEEARLTRDQILQRTARLGGPAPVAADPELMRALYAKLRLAEHLAPLSSSSSRPRARARAANPSEYAIVVQYPYGRREAFAYGDRESYEAALAKFKAELKTSKIARVRGGPKPAGSDFPDPVDYDSIEWWALEAHQKMRAGTGPYWWFPNWIRRHADTVIEWGGRFDRLQYGNGQFGVAMPTYGGKWVLKITADPAEAQIARTLRNIRETDDPLAIPSLVHFNRINRNGELADYWDQTPDGRTAQQNWMSRFGQAGGVRSVHVLEREDVEFVDPMHEAMRQIVSDAYPRLERIMRYGRLFFYAREQNKVPPKDELSEYLRAVRRLTHVPELRAFAEDVWIALREYGLVVSDLHSGNFGVRPGTGQLVVADIGYAPTDPKVAAQIPDLADANRLENPV